LLAALRCDVAGERQRFPELLLRPRGESLIVKHPTDIDREQIEFAVPSPPPKPQSRPSTPRTPQGRVFRSVGGYSPNNNDSQAGHSGMSMTFLTLDLDVHEFDVLCLSTQ
jgi:hypothetical protein